jgi:hypothetical protein
MYTYEKFNLRLLPWFFLILGVVFLFSKMYTEAAIFGSIGLAFSISYTGFSIDAEKRLIRQYDRFLWVYIGNWRPFPTPLYVTVVRIRLSDRRINPIPLPMPDQGKSARTYKMNLVVDGEERYISLTHGSRMEMLTEGVKIAKLLNIKVLDHTTSEKRWLS